MSSTTASPPAPGATAPPVEDPSETVSRILALESDLSFKKKFRPACQEFSRFSEQDTGNGKVDEALLRVADRCHVVLTTRHTNPIFWQSGLDFFLSLQFRLDSSCGRVGGDHGGRDGGGCGATAQQEKMRSRISKFVEQSLEEVDEDAREKLAAEKLQRRREQAERDRRSEAGGGPGVNPFGGGFGGMDSNFEDFIRAQLQGGGTGGLANIANLFEPTPDPRSVHHLDRHELRIVPNDDESAICTICLEPLGKKAKKMPMCGHLFHDACIMESLEHNKSCPLCRDDPLKGQKVYTTDDFRKVDEHFRADGGSMFS
ncbi:unnamed protein product [Amoebophrya sp. A25]|nr:unnamed protein product [Amoebophrya sp. A25]|eukprot:GSA25T00005552001.1